MGKTGSARDEQFLKTGCCGLLLKEVTAFKQAATFIEITML